MRKTLRTLAAAAGMMALAAAPAALAQSGLIDGQVVKIDESASKITIKHGPIKKLGMDEGMTMVFRAEDPSMLKALKPGDKIKFDPDNVNGQFTVKQIQKTR